MSDDLVDPQRLYQIAEKLRRNEALTPDDQAYAADVAASAAYLAEAGLDLFQERRKARANAIELLRRMLTEEARFQQLPAHSDAEAAMALMMTRAETENWSKGEMRHHSIMALRAMGTPAEESYVVFGKYHDMDAESVKHQFNRDKVKFTSDTM